jgi:dTDP-4-dehydrorhamnose 3,5-epimerase
MIIEPTPLEGAYLVRLNHLKDERGWFARTYCADIFAEHGLMTQFVQCNHSYNARKGTLRGMHFQKEPHGEVKLVRCTKGRCFDAIVDLRPDSKTHLQWFGVELSANNGVCMYIPEGFAHGFQTLEDDTELFYQMGSRYQPESASGIPYDDPAFSIQWPDAKGAIISERDLRLERYDHE